MPNPGRIAMSTGPQPGQVCRPGSFGDRPGDRLSGRLALRPLRPSESDHEQPLVVPQLAHT